jgi:hypothetical protein
LVCKLHNNGHGGKNIIDHGRFQTQGRRGKEECILERLGLRMESSSLLVEVVCEALELRDPMDLCGDLEME